MAHNAMTDDWEPFKNEIYSLYIVENRHLLGDEGVIELMDSRFKFKRSQVILCVKLEGNIAVVLTGFRKSAYETRLKKWGFKKYSKGTLAEDYKIAATESTRPRLVGVTFKTTCLGNG